MMRLEVTLSHAQRLREGRQVRCGSFRGRRGTERCDQRLWLWKTGRHRAGQADRRGKGHLTKAREGILANRVKCSGLWIDRFFLVSAGKCHARVVTGDVDVELTRMYRHYVFNGCIDLLMGFSSSYFFQPE